MAGVDETKPFVPLKIAVLTGSDTRELADDKSGATLVGRIEAAGHALADRAIVRDDVAAIRARVKVWIDDPAVDVVITTGGTGFTGRDVTPEAMEPLFEKRMDGFATLFLIVSHAKIGTSAIQTRATAGAAGATYIFCLPGSPPRPAPAATPGTRSWCPSLTTAIAPATSSRSCPASTSTCAAPRPRAPRCRASPGSSSSFRHVMMQHAKAVAVHYCERHVDRRTVFG